MALLNALEPGTEVALVSEGPHPATKEMKQDKTHRNRSVDRDVDAKQHTVPPLGLEPHDVSARNAASTRDRHQFLTRWSVDQLESAASPPHAVVPSAILADVVQDETMNIERLAQDLAAHLVLSRPLVCVDLEATGVWPRRDRIVQIAAASIFPNGSISTWSSLVNPEQPIPPALTAIHGITDAMVASEPTFKQVASTVTTLLSDCDLTGYNVARFDQRLLAAEFGRVEMEDPTIGAHVIDAYTLFIRREPRSLDAALQFYGVPGGQTGRRAHDARSDVEVTVGVLAAQLQKYSDLPRTVEGIHDWLNPRDPNRIDADGKLIWRDGLASVTFGEQAGTSLADLAANDRSFLEWVLRKDFSHEVKTIVRDALEGRFPVRRDGESE